MCCGRRCISNGGVRRRNLRYRPPDTAGQGRDLRTVGTARAASPLGAAGGTGAGECSRRIALSPRREQQRKACARMAGPAGVVGARGRDVSPQRLCRSFEAPVGGNRTDCMSRAAGRGKRLVLRKNPLNFAVASTVRRRRQDARTLASCSPPHGAAANCRHRKAMPNDPDD